MRSPSCIPFARFGSYESEKCSNKLQGLRRRDHVIWNFEEITRRIDHKEIESSFEGIQMAGKDWSVEESLALDRRAK